MTRPINLTTITEKSSLAQINNNFRKIQEELSIFRQNVEPRLKASEDYRDYLELFLGGDRPISRQQAINYTDEQIAAKEAEILEELDSRIGDVNAKIDNLEQLGEDLIEQISTSITELENALTETKEALSKKADLLWTEAQLALKADRELLDTMVTNLEESIATKADAEWVEGRLQTKADVENTYTKQEVDNALNSKVSVTTYTVDKEGFIQQFENHESRISQTEEAISQTVSKTEFEEVQNELGDVVTRLSNAETAIIQNAEQIELRATKDEVDGLENRLGLAETAIMQNSQEIQLRATKAELNEIEDRISSAETMITQNAEQIQLRATKSELEELATDVAGLETRLSNAETSITQNAEEIELRATKTEVQQLENELNAISTRVSNAETAIIQNAEEINLRATKEEVQLIEDEVSSISQNVANLTVAYDNISSEVSRVEQDLDGKIQANTSLIQQTAQGINARIDEFRYEYDQDKTDILSSVEQNRSEINALSNQIQLRVTREEFENLEIGGRNLLRNSDFSKGLEHWQSNGSISLVNVDGKKAIKLTGTTGGFYQYPTNLEENTYYTISLKAKSVGETSSLRFGFLNQGAGLERAINVDSTWRKYTLTTTKFIDFNRDTLLHFYANNNTAEGVYITEIKIEKGNKATDWTPAPEDTQQQIDDTINRISQVEATLSIHADQIEAKAEKSEVYTRSEVDSALGKKVDTTVFTEQIGTLTTSINSVSARVSNTETAINSITGEIEDVLNQVSSLEVTTNGIVQSVSSIEGELSDIGNRLTRTESSITTLSNEIELKASQTEVDTLERRMSEAEASLSVLPGQIEARVEKDGVIGAINASPEELLIEFDRIRMEGMLEARHIRSLAGLNVNDQFIVDSQGNVKFSGHLEGASGTFSGNLTTEHLVIGPPEPTLYGWLDDQPSTIELKNPVRVSNDFYVWGDPFLIKVGNNYTSIIPPGRSIIEIEARTLLCSHIKAESIINDSFDTPLWTGALYPLSTHTIRPSKNIFDCMTGWILRWQAFNRNDGTVANSDFHYVHIPKIHVLNNNGAGVRSVLGRGGVGVIGKYVYVYDDRIVGHDSNNQGDNHNLVLTGVFEY